MEIYHGDILYAESREKLNVYENSYIAVDQGKVEGIYPVVPEQYKDIPVTDHGRGLIIPAFSDLHMHAPAHLQGAEALGGADLGKFHELGETVFQKFEQGGLARLGEEKAGLDIVLGQIPLEEENHELLGCTVAVVFRGFLAVSPCVYVKWRVPKASVVDLRPAEDDAVLTVDVARREHGVGRRTVICVVRDVVKVGVLADVALQRLGAAEVADCQQGLRRRP